MSERVVWVDIARGIAILTIVIVHTGFLPLQYQLLPLQDSWSVLIFSYTAGYLACHVGKKKIHLARKILSLLRPYLIYGVLGFITWSIVRAGYHNTVLNESYGQAITQYVLGYNIVFNGPLWFLPLFITGYSISAGVFLLWVRVHAFIRFLIPILLIGVVPYLNPQWQQYPWSWDLAFLIAGMYFVGYLSDEYSNIVFRPRVWVGIALLFVITAYFIGDVNLLGRRFHSYPLFVLNAILGCIMISGVAMHTARGHRFQSFLSWVGERSLVVFATHSPIMQVLTFILIKSGFIDALHPVPVYNAFSYHIENGIVFTIVEILLLALYISVVLIAVWIAERISRRAHVRATIDI